MFPVCKEKGKNVNYKILLIAEIGSIQSKAVIGWQKTLIYNLLFQEPIEHAPGTVCSLSSSRKSMGHFASSSSMLK